MGDDVLDGGMADQLSASPHPAPLPAPYRSPWRRLGEDLRAVLADLGLGLRRLLRLNRQGDLRQPPFWPRSLAALFWPLLLLLVLALLVAGTVWLLPRSAGPSPPPAPRPTQPGPPEPGPPEPRATAASPPVSSPAEAQQAPPDAGPGPPEPEPQGPSQPLPPDPLAALLQRPGAGGLLAAAAGDPGRSLLCLELEPGFKALATVEQQRQADLWLQWAQDLGYERLELRDGRGQLVAREALVGNGMILISSRVRP